MSYKKKLSKVLFLIVAVVIQFSLFAKERIEHSKDMLEVLGLYAKGFENNVSNNKIMNEVIYFITDSIDYTTENKNIYGDFYEVLKTKMRNKYPDFEFTWGKYGHRLLYHWGFDYKDQPSHNALRKQFEIVYKVDTNSTQGLQMWNFFLELVMEEQNKRNEKMVEKVSDFFFGKNPPKNVAHGIAGILYYTHLLGDHIKHTDNSTFTVEAVLSVEQISRNLDSYVKNIATHGNVKQYQEYAKYKTQVAYNLEKYVGNEARAEELLILLKRFVPQLLERNFKNTFEELGLRFAKPNPYAK